jgi:hypothetical protein
MLITLQEFAQLYADGKIRLFKAGPFKQLQDGIDLHQHQHGTSEYMT